MIAWLGTIFRDSLIWFHGFTGNWGVDIILLTVAVRVVILPLTLYQTKAMKKMQEVQPEVKRIQELYKGQPEKLNKEMMDVYRKHGVNPLAGCLPTLVQLPFLWALFNTLRAEDLFTGAAGFLWVPNLASPDPLYMMPVLTAVTTFWQSYISGQGNEPTQRMMLYLLPLMFAWFTISFPAGVALYWVVSTLFGIIQQYIYPGVVRRTGGAAAK